MAEERIDRIAGATAETEKGAAQRVIAVGLPVFDFVLQRLQDHGVTGYSYELMDSEGTLIDREAASSRTDAFWIVPSGPKGNDSYHSLENRGFKYFMAVLDVASAIAADADQLYSYDAVQQYVSRNSEKLEVVVDQVLRESGLLVSETPAE